MVEFEDAPEFIPDEYETFVTVKHSCGHECQYSAVDDGWQLPPAETLCWKCQPCEACGHSFDNCTCDPFAD